MKPPVGAVVFLEFDHDWWLESGACGNALNESPEDRCVTGQTPPEGECHVVLVPAEEVRTRSQRSCREGEVRPSHESTRRGLLIAAPPRPSGGGSRPFDGVVLDALGAAKWTPGREAEHCSVDGVGD